MEWVFRGISLMTKKRLHAGAGNLVGTDASGVKSFFIYGFEERAFDGRFLHFERIEEQLAYHDWDAKPHLHKGLHQLMVFESGGGEILIEDQWQPFQAPVMIFIPEGMVHGFHFQRDTAGPILTISEDFMSEALGFVEKDIALTARRPALIHLDAEALAQHGIDGIFRGIERDYRWIAPGRNTALMANLVLLFVSIARLSSWADAAGRKSEAYVEIYDAFRKHIELSFRKQPTVAEVAKEIGLTVGRLTSVCRSVASFSPQELIHQRIITEAKRQLLYSPRSSTSISYMLGFKDPAYFSRFFKRATGESPVEFRKRASETALSNW
jgi:AraC family transcriptional activator of pobA